MRVLALSKYDRLAASPRLRFLAYGPALAEVGLDLDFSPLLSDRYLSKLFASERTSRRNVAQNYLHRLLTLPKVRRYDLVWLQYELFPYLPPFAERLLARLGVPYVVDYDDAIFHMYDEHRNPAVRAVLGDKIGAIIRGARAVTAGSGYLADYARRFNGDVHVVPTVIDLERYRLPEAPVGERPFTIGWIGSPSTSVYLDLVAPALARLAKEAPLRLVLVGSPPRTIEGVDVDVRPWGEATEVSDLLDCDVGIMPLPDEPWARGKCAFKLIQYMACALPTVSSPVGANREVVTAETGLPATNPDEWVAALRTLRDDPALRRRLGAAGRARVEAGYSLQSQEARVQGILQSAARR